MLLHPQALSRGKKPIKFNSNLTYLVTTKSESHKSNF